MMTFTIGFERVLQILPLYNSMLKFNDLFLNFYNAMRNLIIQKTIGRNNNFLSHDIPLFSNCAITLYEHISI